MKKNLFLLIFLFNTHLLFSQERAMYVDNFNVIINSTTQKTNLLQYAQNHQITYLILYDLHLVNNQYNLSNSATNQILANFIADAKNNYGINKIAAAGENATFFQNVIMAYNSSRSLPKEKFDVLGMEFEFWTPTFTNPGGFYCNDYLIPNGLPCDSTGAFAFCKSQLMLMKTMANASSHPMKTEMYVGWPNAGQLKIIADLVDKTLIHAYVTNPNTAFNYALTRLQNYNTYSGVEKISIIYSSEPSFMGPWLNANNMTAAESIFTAAYNASSGAWKSHVIPEGFTYFTYSMMNSVSLSLQLIDFEGITNKNTAKLIWKIENENRTKTFEIEKSDDGEHFSKIGIVDFDGKNIYQFEDFSFEKNAFYRLKIIDSDRYIDFSKVIFLEKKSDSALKIFPNPSQDLLFIQNEKVEKTPFLIFNQLGKIEKSGILNHSFIEIEDLPSGIYFLQVENQTVKFVKK
jgi:hypothetical protein